MCNRSNQHTHTGLSPKATFYKKLRAYLGALATIFTLAVLVDDGFFDIFRLVAAIGGISLSLRFVKLNGLPGTKGWLSDDWFDWIQARYPHASAQAPKPEKGEDYDPLWKDKDLV